MAPGMPAKTLLLFVGLLGIGAGINGCASSPLTLGATAVSSAISGVSTLAKNHAEDTFLVDQDSMRNVVLQALQTMALRIDTTSETAQSIKFKGSSGVVKSPLRFTATLGIISPTVTKVSIRAGRGILSPDYSTAEEILHQIILHLEQAKAIPRKPTAASAVSRTETSTVASFALAPAAQPDRPSQASEAEVDTPSPYVVQIASYRTKAYAERHVQALRDRKVEAYTVPFVLPNKGRWHRVLVRRFPTIKEARSFAAQMMTAGLVDLAFPLSLPFAVEVSAPGDRKAMAVLTERLRHQGFWPYILPMVASMTTEPQDRLLVGAYATHSAALLLSGQLRAAGIPNQVVAP